jgi:enterobacterial common antigen flippase
MAIDERGPDGQSHLQILKSTAVIGGASVINIVFAIIRNKAIALLLGPQGFGLLALYSSIADLAQALAGLGVQQSGVRQIAEAVGSGDQERIVRTVTLLRRVSIVLGLAGAALLAAFAFPVADITFGNRTYGTAVMIVAAAIFFRLVSAGQTALIQGMRRVSDLALISVLGAFFSTAISIPLIYWLGEEGIAWAILAMAAASILTSWWYARKIRIDQTATMSLQEVKREVAPLLKLGAVFMASGFLTAGAAYAIRIVVLRYDGVAAAGFYQAAWALGGLYAGFILQAMGTDFYPRLTAVSSDNAACNRLVNEQAQVSMLLAGPGLIATLTAAPLVMTLFYSREFLPAVDLARWICLGMMLRIIAWPMGFIVLAKGASRIFFWTEVAATIVHVGLAWLLVPLIGVSGAGIAFCGLYVWHTALIYVILRRLSGFRWTPVNSKLAVGFLSAACIVFAACLTLPVWIGTVVGTVATLISGLFSLWMLLKLLPPETLPQAVRHWLPSAA